MPRYFFDVVSPHGTKRDTEGRDLQDISAARAEAADQARRAAEAEQLQGDLSGYGIAVRTETGEVCAIQPFPAADASLPAAGPHARAELMNPDATPGAGTLPAVGEDDNESMPATG